MKGIILAGGSGTRLYPFDHGHHRSSCFRSMISRMIYYPMSVLMNAGIRDILIIFYAAGHTPQVP